MTICIGAVSINSNATEKYAVVASDRMVTLSLPSIEFEQKLSKSIQITPNSVISTAGSALAFSDILDDTRLTIDPSRTTDLPLIVETLRQSYVKIRTKKMEERLLASIRLASVKEFYERNQSLARDIVGKVFDAMAKFNYGLTLMIAGVDKSGAHVYRIDNPGMVTTYDGIGYCAIGIGEIHAISTFIANDYDPFLDLNHVVALTYEAKKRSEKAQGVGQQSDLFIICNDKTVKLTDENGQKIG